MRKSMYSMFCMFLFLILIVSGCADSRTDVRLSEASPDQDAVGEETSPVSETDRMQMSEMPVYEYEMQELYA